MVGLLGEPIFTARPGRDAEAGGAIPIPIPVRADSVALPLKVEVVMEVEVEVTEGDEENFSAGRTATAAGSATILDGSELLLGNEEEDDDCCKGGRIRSSEVVDVDAEDSTARTAGSV